jgi:hypothetical protein
MTICRQVDVLYRDITVATGTLFSDYLLLPRFSLSTEQAPIRFDLNF